MKFANLLLDQRRMVALVDASTERYWSIASLIPGFDGDMVRLVQDFPMFKERLAPKDAGQPLAQARILAPIDQPRRNLFCVGKNYHEHAAEFQRSGFDSSSLHGEHAPEAPVVFTKPGTAIIGPGERIARHAGVTSQLDYEAELGVVIGKAGKGISRQHAMEHVFGYTVINDVTARDLQKRHRQWFLGKSLDGFCPMGPHLVTADEIDGGHLDIKTWVNGELRQNSNTSRFIFDIPSMIETLSAGIELHPGDVLATGTPAGVGIGFAPPRFLQSGDVVRIEIEGIGVLENEVGE